MPLQLRSRPTTDTLRSPSLSPFATPASKPQIPTICLTTATPCDANSTDDANHVAPWTTFEASPVPTAPKPSTSGETSRKRLVPKKSKLSLLGSSSSAKAREQDFSDVVRRVGRASVQNGSNGRRNRGWRWMGCKWGTLGEVTNVPAVTKPKEKGGKKESLPKVKVDENQKWWSIGRGRKDSKQKDKGKDKERAKSPEPTAKPADTCARHNSLDSGILLSSADYEQHPKAPMESLRVPTPPSVTLAPPDAAGLGQGSGKDSVAHKGYALCPDPCHIGSWAQLKNMPNPDTAAAALAPVKD
ncbi:hypothetical protein JVT61DRAFT_13298 [Boletus reticuloceps]|uniref:Uncharacterized protein n=1 Tax=Boletus reticuloceps TaxID=495285 RepID=A0A8I2YXI3_9AGAM|nr:hypothetical protein JVT61DRAFT_13298 [Boletus reticuloceps]